MKERVSVEDSSRFLVVNPLVSTLVIMLYFRFLMSGLICVSLLLTRIPSIGFIPYFDQRSYRSIAKRTNEEKTLKDCILIIPYFSFHLRHPAHTHTRTMEAWLSDVKQIRIPRPKFGISAGSPPRHSRMPPDPPRDYMTSGVGDDATSGTARKLTGADLTEDLRQSLRDKL